jgi:hypothetical protein
VIRLFVSYRRSDSKSFAHRLHDRLRRVFGRAVFMDVSDIDPGEDFPKVIDARLAACKVLVAVIGNTWASATDAEGRRRLHVPGDYVRLEVSKALASGLLVIPVLVNGARMPDAAELPEDLEQLPKRNAIQMDDDRFDTDVERLIDAITPVVPPRSRLPLIALTLAAVLALATAGIWLHGRVDPGSGVRLIPGPALYAKLPTDAGGAGKHYDLIVEVAGRTVTLPDLTRTIVYTGADGADLDKLRARQDTEALSREIAKNFETLEEGHQIVAQLLQSGTTLPIVGSRPGARIRVEVGRYDFSPDTPREREPWFECDLVLGRGAQTFLLTPASNDCRRIAP